MSDNRKVLVAKRKDDRRKTASHIAKDQDFNNSKRGTKRPVPSNSTPQKNLANDRLKKLRTSLNEEAHKSSSSANRTFHPVQNKPNSRKRQQSDYRNPTTVVKLYKRQETKSESRFVLNDDQNQNVFFETNTSPLLKQCDPGPSFETTEHMEWCPTEDSPSCSSNFNNEASNNEFVIVVDTNIFLSQLQTIKNILSATVKGETKPVVFIPWIVLEELDFIKEDNRNGNLRFRAQEAIKYVESNLSSHHERMRGQTLEEVNQQKSTGKSQDNKIIASCLQLLEKKTKMILLTGDINLKNKAHFNNIPVCSHTEILTKISRQSQTKYELITDKMTALCRGVISECARSAYGPASQKMAICQTPMKSLQDCISIFTKYWFPVFQEYLMKQFKKSIDDLSKFLNEKSRISDDKVGINDLVRLCVRVCLFLKDVECCKSAIERTISDLNDIKES